MYLERVRPAVKTERCEGRERAKSGRINAPKGSVVDVLIFWQAKWYSRGSAHALEGAAEEAPGFVTRPGLASGLHYPNAQWYQTDVGCQCDAAAAGGG